MFNQSPAPLEPPFPEASKLDTPEPPVFKPSEEPKKPRSKIVPVLVFLLLVALGVAGYFGWQNYQLKLKQEAVDVQPEPSPVAKVDETEGWEIYTNTKYGYSLKYPPGFEVVESGMGSGNLDTAMAITVFDKTQEDPIFASRFAVTILLDNRETIEDRVQNHFNRISTYTLSEEAIENWTLEYGFKPNNNKPISQVTKSLFQDLSSYEYSINGNNVDDGAGQYLTPIQDHQYIWVVNNNTIYLIYASDVPITNKILSTFEFVDKSTYYKELFPEPAYIYTDHVFAHYQTRCLCYGEIIESEPDPASDPPVISDCIGWIDESTCELKEGDGDWSRQLYLDRYKN
jgi:hypothetical protein